LKDEQKPIPKLKKPNVKQQQFVKELLKPGATQASAYQVTYGVENKQVAAVAASALVHHPVVARHIADVLAEQYPEAAEDCTRTLREFIQDPNLRPSERMKAMELLTKFLGWQQPTKSLTLHAKVDASKYRLPGDEK